ncbi:MAG: hypothetical protein KC609_24740, partial [Myxococcales bacterium]|nr:hypothetical protein [Myxococcales bacterium]
MICFRCGFTIQPGEEKCGNCGADQRAKTPRTSPGLRDLFSSVREEPSIDRAPYLIGELVTERYELLDLLGSSTFSTVYRCLDKDDAREYALKVFSPLLFDEPALRHENMALLYRAVEIEHLNICRTFRIANDGDNVFAVQQLLVGITLDRLLDRRRQRREVFAIADVLPVAEQILDALSYLAASGNMAVDLSPRRIVILPDMLTLTGHLPLLRPSGKSRQPSPYTIAGLGGERGATYALSTLISEMLCGFIPSIDESLQSVVPGLPLSMEALLRRGRNVDAHPTYGVERMRDEFLEASAAAANLELVPPPPPDFDDPASLDLSAPLEGEIDDAPVLDATPVVAYDRDDPPDLSRLGSRSATPPRGTMPARGSTAPGSGGRAVGAIPAERGATPSSSPALGGAKRPRGMAPQRPTTPAPAEPPPHAREPEVDAPESPGPSPLGGPPAGGSTATRPPSKGDASAVAERKLTPPAVLAAAMVPAAPTEAQTPTPERPASAPPAATEDVPLAAPVDVPTAVASAFAPLGAGLLDLDDNDLESGWDVAFDAIPPPPQADDDDEDHVASDPRIQVGLLKKPPRIVVTDGSEPEAPEAPSPPEIASSRGRVAMPPRSGSAPMRERATSNDRLERSESSPALPIDPLRSRAATPKSRLPLDEGVSLAGPSRRALAETKPPVRAASTTSEPTVALKPMVGPPTPPVPDASKSGPPAVPKGMPPIPGARREVTPPPAPAGPADTADAGASSSERVDAVATPVDDKTSRPPGPRLVPTRAPAVPEPPSSSAPKLDADTPSPPPDRAAAQALESRGQTPNVVISGPEAASVVREPAAAPNGSNAEAESTPGPEDEGPKVVASPRQPGAPGAGGLRRRPAPSVAPNAPHAPGELRRRSMASGPGASPAMSAAIEHAHPNQLPLLITIGAVIVAIIGIGTFIFVTRFDETKQKTPARPIQVVDQRDGTTPLPQERDIETSAPDHSPVVPLAPTGDVGRGDRLAPPRDATLTQTNPMGERDATAVGDTGTTQVVLTTTTDVTAPPDFLPDVAAATADTLAPTGP